MPFGRSAGDKHEPFGSSWEFLKKTPCLYSRITRMFFFNGRGPAKQSTSTSHLGWQKRISQEHSTKKFLKTTNMPVSCCNRVKHPFWASKRRSWKCSCFPQNAVDGKNSATEGMLKTCNGRGDLHLFTPTQVIKLDIFPISSRYK